MQDEHSASRQDRRRAQYRSCRQRMTTKDLRVERERQRARYQSLTDEQRERRRAQQRQRYHARRMRMSEEESGVGRARRQQPANIGEVAAVSSDVPHPVHSVFDDHTDAPMLSPRRPTTSETTTNFPSYQSDLVRDVRHPTNIPMDHSVSLTAFHDSLDTSPSTTTVMHHLLTLSAIGVVKLRKVRNPSSKQLQIRRVPAVHRRLTDYGCDMRLMTLFDLLIPTSLLLQPLRLALTVPVLLINTSCPSTDNHDIPLTWRPPTSITEPHDEGPSNRPHSTTLPLHRFNAVIGIDEGALPASDGYHYSPYCVPIPPDHLPLSYIRASDFSRSTMLPPPTSNMVREIDARELRDTWRPPASIPEPRDEGPSRCTQPTGLPHRQGRIPQRQRSHHNCARDFVDNPPLQRFRLQGMHNCSHCSVLLFPHESQELCCMNGTINIPFPTVPPQLMTLYTSDNVEAKHFRENIRAYNHVFSFTSIGVHVDETLANSRSGVYTYRALGTVCHRIGSLLPQTGQRPRFLQMYIYDTDHEMEHRLAENETLNRQVLAILQQVLDRFNPYVRVFRNISERNDIENLRLILKESRTRMHQYALPTSTVVAAILVGGEDVSELNQRDIIVQAKSGRLHNVSDTAGYYDPLQYPVLHPYGSYGWDVNTFQDGDRKISCREYYSYLLQIRPNSESILLRGGRLLQQYVVDQYVKILTQQLCYIRDNQPKLRAELYQGLQDSLNAGETNASHVSRRIILPASYIGNPQDMHRRYHDAMALVRKYGKPDIFLTMTCNSNWDEIRELLLPGQTPQDRPDIVARVFRAKCEQLKEDLFVHHVLGKVIAHVHVIEFQKRGLPHAHFLLIFDDADKLKNPDDYDRVVRAYIPNPILELESHSIVLRHMINGPCGDLNRDSVCMKNGFCKKNFPKPYCDNTLQGNDSFPMYKRPRNGLTYVLSGLPVDNSWVVPYNAWLLKKYDCHINVEICSTVKSVKYLYKYVCKGSDRVRMEVSSAADNDRDEIRRYIDVRWVCPHEALWRIFMFPLSRMYPAVYQL